MKPTVSLSQLKKMSQPERLAAFTDWLAAQPRETPYSYNDVCGCALAQFGRSVRPWWLPVLVGAGGTYFSYFMTLTRVEIMPEPNTGRWEPVSHLIHSKTLGELHDRLRGSSLTDAQMEAIEDRALVAWQRALR